MEDLLIQSGLYLEELLKNKQKMIIPLKNNN